MGNRHAVRDEWDEQISATGSTEAFSSPSTDGHPPDWRLTASRRLRLGVKRAMDICVAAAVLFVLAPLMAVIALLVAWKQGRPVLFRQQRPGLNEKPFRMSKFRTMRSPREGEGLHTSDDDRITALGRFLRNSSLDELPEFWHVLRGHMSLVGPRPLLMEYLPKYTPEEQRRHGMRPGVTGWAAVNGRHTLDFRDRIALDVWYVDNWSLALDMRIMFMTAKQVLSRDGVTATQDLSLGFPLD